VAVPVLAAIVAIIFFLLRRRRQRQKRDDLILPYLGDKVGGLNGPHEIQPFVPPPLPSRDSEEEGPGHRPAVVAIAPVRGPQNNRLNVVESQREKETVLRWGGSSDTQSMSAAGASGVVVIGAPAATDSESPPSANAEYGTQWGEIPTPDLLRMLDARVNRGLTPKGDNPPDYHERVGR
jgi:hypothetical protein